MGDTAVISYRSLGEASSEARQVSRKLTGYADSLQRSIVNRLDSYGGSDSGGVTQAKRRTEEKIEQLRDKAQAYTKYADDLSDLQKKCLSTDTAVRSRVSGLTASFKKANGINNNGIVNAINYMLTGLGNSTPAGRWLGNTIDTANSAKDYLKQRIKDWWGYEGGKQLAKGVAIGVLECVIAVCGVIGAVLSGGALLVVIAGVISGVIAFVNGFVNIRNEKKAYEATKNGDPATGRRRSEINTLQGYLRSSFIFGSDGETYEYNATYHTGANAIDIVDTVCSVVSVVDGVGSLTKNAYKWTTGSMADIKNLHVKDILTKDNLSLFGNKVQTTFKEGISDISKAMRSGNFEKIGDAAWDLGDDFINNLKKGYTFEIFVEDLEIKDYVKHGAELVENYANIEKTLLEKGVSFHTVAVEIGMDTLVLPNVNVFETVTYNTGEKQDKRGVFAYEISGVSVDDITSAFTDTFEMIPGISDVVEKLSEKSRVTIKIPEISIPVINNIKVA